MLPKSFYADDPAVVARELLGKVLCRRLEGEVLAGFIVETEAYYGRSDPASRAYRSRGDLAATLYGEVGRALVYGVHGNWLFNVVAHKPRGGGAVLIRAVEPVLGVEVMKRLRGVSDLYKLASGPGRLCKAMGIDKSLHKKPVYLEGSELTIREGRRVEGVARSFRIGVARDLGIPLRFYVKNSRFLSTR